MLRGGALTAAQEQTDLDIPNIVAEILKVLLDAIEAVSGRWGRAALALAFAVAIVFALWRLGT